MSRLLRLCAVLAIAAPVMLRAQNWTMNYPYASWNSTSNDFMHAPALQPGAVFFMSDRPEVNHGKIKVTRCGHFKKPYSLFRGSGNEAVQVTDLGTERWAGVPVFSPKKDFMAVPQWSTECTQGVAGVELLLYRVSDAASDLKFEGQNWKLVRKASQPEFSTAHQPVFAPKKDVLVFAGERAGRNSDLYTLDLQAPEFAIAPMQGDVNSPGDEVYPRYWGDTLLYSRPTLRGLDVFSWDGSKSFALPEITNSGAHDFNLWVHNADSAWINTRRDATHTDLWVLTTPKKKPASAPEKPKAEVAKPAMDEIIYAGKFANPKNAEALAAQLASDPNLKGQVSVEYNGSHYIVVVTPPAGAANASLAAVRQRVADAAITQIPVRGKAMDLEIYFDFDKYAVRPGEARRIRDFLKQIDAQNGTFELVGHCDARGTNLYNLTLGLNRSKSVKRFMEHELGRSIKSSEYSRSEWDLQEPCPDGVDCPDSKHERNRRVVLRFRP